MSLFKMPSAGTPYRLSDVFFAKLGLFQSERVINRFTNTLKHYFNVENLTLVNSGTTANFVIYNVLKDLRKRVEQVEIILPAYTAPSLLLPIEAAQLKAVLVDIDPDTFNLSVEKVQEKLSEKTLAIMPVHMFGLPCEVETFLTMTKNTDIFVLEDGASALGTKVNNRHIGTIAPFGFYSLNRGKNVSTLAGGIITWQDAGLTELFRKHVGVLPALSQRAKWMMFLRFCGLSLAVRPFPYTLLNPIISKYKYTTLHTHFDSFQYTQMQAALGMNLWKRIDSLDQKRIENGRRLTEIFHNKPGFTLPTIPHNSQVAFNQFPVIVDDLGQREAIIGQLSRRGIEATTLYDHPLHHIFPELDTAGDDPYPHATYLAEHLLLIPPHAQINTRIIHTVQNVIANLA
ncbi:MAG: DegT/DnrJ/EryC1/StrS family aminotransferase [Fidelibacterota bacterium]